MPAPGRAAQSLATTTVQPGTAPASEPRHPPAAAAEAGALTPAQIAKARAAADLIADQIPDEAWAEVARIIRAARTPLPRTA